MSRLLTSLAPASLLVATGRSQQVGAPLNTPLMPASNFRLGGARAYARDDGTATWEALEDIIGQLEQGSCTAFASGMAAIAAIFESVPAGAVVVLPDNCYQGVAGLAARGHLQRNWKVARLPVDDTAAWVAACATADLLWLESPSNPMLTVADVQTICRAPRGPRTKIAVDNTFATSLNQLPLALGADYSFQSATKFIGGHSDLLAGVVTVTAPALHHELRAAREYTGGTPGALEAFLAVRGARTLALRLERAQANAMVLAQRLATHPAVALTRYPGLTSHPTHALARDQMRGFGTMISFDVAGDAATADRVCAAVQLIVHATSLGAVESTIERRAAIAGQGHLPPSLLRLSVGIEQLEDLWADIDAALRSTQAPS